MLEEEWGQLTADQQAVYTKLAAGKDSRCAARLTP